MPAFDEIALQPAFPVIHSQRKDGTSLTAIRVPTDDVRLDKWGWILTLSNKNRLADQDDIKRLNDNNNQRYPKIYTLDEIHNYIESWNCYEWEVGYYGNDSKIHSRRITAPLNTDMLQEDMLQATLADIKAAQTEQLSTLISEFAVQARDIRDEFRAKNADVQELLQTQFLNIQGNVNRLLNVNEELGKQFAAVDTSIKESTVQIQEKTIEEAKNYIIQACEEIQKQLDNINERIETQLSTGQEKLHQEILSQARITGEETKKAA